MYSARAAAPWAVLAVCAAFLWQFLTVTCNYQGNWSALFQTGSGLNLPPGRVFEGTYVFPGTLGFDGQFYRYVAHDPILTRGFDDYADFPRMRWSRILVPALAHILAFGQQAYIDAAYAGVLLGFLFLGVYWLSAWFQQRGRHPAWGLMFLLVPAVLISIERLTIDLALLALCTGFALHAEKASWKTYAILALAPLVRDTGIFLAGAYFLFRLRKRDWRSAGLAVIACVPFGVWSWFVYTNVPASPIRWDVYFPAYPLRGILLRTFYPPLPWNQTELKQAIAGSLDYLALIGIWAALVFAVRLLWKAKRGPLEIAIGLFTLLALILANMPTWGEAYSFGRYLSPLLLWLTMDGVVTRRAYLVVPLGLVVLRVLAQVTPQTLGIMSGLLGGRMDLGF